MEEEERGHQILQLANYWLKVGPEKKSHILPQKNEDCRDFFSKKSK